MFFPSDHSQFLLRTFEEKDLELLYKGLSHPDVIRYYGISYSTREGAKLQLDFFCGLERSGTGRWWGIWSADQEVFFGAVGLNDISWEHKCGEIGFWLMPEQWGKGILAALLPEIIRYAFNDLRLHRLEATVESENQASKGLLRKCGFTFEGCRRECEIKNGQYISLETWAILGS